MSSGHSFGQKRLIPLGVSKSVVIASDRTGLSICRARIERSNLLRLCTRLPDSNSPFLGSGGNELSPFKFASLERGNPDAARVFVQTLSTIRQYFIYKTNAEDAENDNKM